MLNRRSLKIWFSDVLSTSGKRDRPGRGVTRLASRVLTFVIPTDKRPDKWAVENRDRRSVFGGTPNTAVETTALPGAAHWGFVPRGSILIPLTALWCGMFFMPLRAPANDWPHWRGPKQNGISTEKGWTSNWPAEGPPIVWKASVGMGFSSISVADGRAFTSGNANDADTVFCLDAKNGKEIWKHDYPAELGDKYFEGGTTGTPTVDGDRVFTLSRWGDVFCFEAATGKVIWNRNLAKDASARVPSWGFGGSPTIHDNILLLNVGETGMALDKSTGTTIWQSPAKDAGYSTPLPWQENGKWAVLLGSEKAYLAVDLLTGKELWSIRWLTQYGVNAPDPIPDGDRVFISSGYGKGAALLKITDQPEPEVIWKSKVLATQLNSSVLVDGFLYGLSGDGGDDAPLKCVEYATGTEKWSYPHIGTGGLIASDGKLIVTGSKGELLVFAVSSAEAKILARAQVLGGKCWTAPVLANGFVYCRNSRGDVICLNVHK